MKKKTSIFIALVGLFLLAACGPKDDVGPIEFDNSGKTPTPIVVPTCTPEASPSPVPILHPTATPVATPTTVPEPAITV